MEEIAVSYSPLFKLKIKILERFGRQYVAAKLLGLRDDELSLILMGRKRLTEEMIVSLEKVLRTSRKDFLPESYPKEKQR